MINAVNAKERVFERALAILRFMGKVHREQLCFLTSDSTMFSIPQYWQSNNLVESFMLQIGFTVFGAGYGKHQLGRYAVADCGELTLF